MCFFFLYLEIQFVHKRRGLSRYNPTWIETKYLLVQSLKDILTLNVYDFNDHRKNTLMAAASFDLSKLLDDATQEGIVAPLLKDGKDRGELRFDVNYYPVVEPEEGKEEILDSSTFFFCDLPPARYNVHRRTSFFTYF